ncbi:3-keto-disaccharide hydrolase [Echinicola shivajiensis]|uniref:3-keto-disaccharide hydrolase n=1 Tax=Echinicola shivajiensis TaxID=1035916 RepID=UPI00374295B4
MLKLRHATYLAMVLCVGCSTSSSKSKDQEQPQEEWQALFNGENLEGWIPKIHHHESGENYRETFRVQDGVILVNYDGYDEGFDERYGHLFYKEPFSSFHLKWKYRFTDEWLEDAPSYTYRNSGVMFHSQSPESQLKEQDWPISVEYQMLAEAKEGVPRPTGNMCSPGTEVYFEGEMDPRHCINSTSPTYKWDEWVQADLIVFEDSLVIHMVNGDTVLQYTQPQIGGGVANRFDPELKVDGQMLTEGYIGLQSEGQGVMFKDIQIMDLSKKEE